MAATRGGEAVSAGQDGAPVHPPRRHQRGTLFQRKNGLWIGKVRDPRSVRTGMRRMLSVSSVDAATAAEKLDRLIDDLDAEYAAAGGYSTAGWLRVWAAEIHAVKVRPSTIRKYLSVIDNHIVPAIGDVPLHRLAPHHLRRMLAAVPTSRNALTCDTVMRRALADAVRERAIDHNPADAVHKPRHTPEDRLQLTAEQARTLIATAEAKQDPYAARWAAAFMTGARSGEILGLQWDRVDLDPAGGTVDLTWQLLALPWLHGCPTPAGARQASCGRRMPGHCPQRTPMRPRGFEHTPLHNNLALTRPKTKASIRRVPLTDSMRDMLAERKIRDIGPNPHNLVWHEADGRPISPTDDHNRWKDALAAAGLPNVTRHSSRATAATVLLDAGVDEATRMAILGHVSATAHRVYLDIDQTRIRAALANLDELPVGKGDQP
jgi:integrase